MSVMEVRTPRPKLLCGSSFAICLIAGLLRTDGQEYLSNLGNRWIDPSNPNTSSIGDIEVLNSGYGPFIVYFFTGSGLAQAKTAKMRIGVPATEATNSTIITHQFRMDSVTFEFVGGIGQPWPYVTVEVYQQVDSQNERLVGELGHPSLNPMPTQWPSFSSFIDFHPLTNIALQPSSEYFIALSESYDLIPAFAMLFSLSSNYVASTDWRMGPTVTHVPVNFTEYLMFSVNATTIQGTNSAGGSGTNSTGVSVSNVRLSAIPAGSNILLSWPTSTAPSQLYASPTFESNTWSPVSTQPVRINDHFVVSLPVTSSGSYFRLQGRY